MKPVRAEARFWPGASLGAMQRYVRCWGAPEVAGTHSEAVTQKRPLESRFLIVSTVIRLPAGSQSDFGGLARERSSISVPHDILRRKL